MYKMNFRIFVVAVALIGSLLVAHAAEQGRFDGPTPIVPPPTPVPAPPAFATPIPTPPTIVAAQAAAAAEPKLLAWDADQKSTNSQPGQATAEFYFGVTNVSGMPVVIDNVTTSCGCTVAKLPSQPWVLEPGADGKIDVTVNLAGKYGTVYKQVTVHSTNAPKVLTVVVNIPNTPNNLPVNSGTMDRARNQQMALADRQAVFKGDCARCHVEPAKDKMGKQLYATACAICHNAVPRATMVADLSNLKEPTNYEFWKNWISNGKDGTLMPGFSTAHGGPLTDEQIDSLAKVLVEIYPSKVAGNASIATPIPAPSHN